MEDQNLIVAVCSRPVLYDTTMVSYRDRNKKERAWVDVAEDTGVPGWPCPKTTGRDEEEESQGTRGEHKYTDSHPPGPAEAKCGAFPYPALWE
ncbi:unnamed protein product [Gadus morhua 'NCC']